MIATLNSILESTPAEEIMSAENKTTQKEKEAQPTKQKKPFKLKKNSALNKILIRIFYHKHWYKHPTQVQIVFANGGLITNGIAFRDEVIDAGSGKVYRIKHFYKAGCTLEAQPWISFSQEI